MQNSFIKNLTSISAILLNQAALYKCQLTELPLRLSDLASRCHMGAIEIANTIRQTSNVHVTYQCAYNSFCIYVGARVFVEMLRQPCPANAPNQGPSKEQLEGDLNMMVAALQTFTIHVPLAGHFLMQLEADMNGLEKLVSVRPYDVNVGYNECHVRLHFHLLTDCCIRFFTSRPLQQTQRIQQRIPGVPKTPSGRKPRLASRALNSKKTTIAHLICTGLTGRAKRRGFRTSMFAAMEVPATRVRRALLPVVLLGACPSATRLRIPQPPRVFDNSTLTSSLGT
jgi:hypothetical protein